MPRAKRSSNPLTADAPQVKRSLTRSNNRDQKSLLRGTILYEPSVGASSACDENCDRDVELRRGARNRDQEVAPAGGDPTPPREKIHFLFTKGVLMRTPLFHEHPASQLAVNLCSRTRGQYLYLSFEPSLKPVLFDFKIITPLEVQPEAFRQTEIPR